MTGDGAFDTRRRYAAIMDRGGTAEIERTAQSHPVKGGPTRFKFLQHRLSIGRFNPPFPNYYGGSIQLGRDQLAPQDRTVGAARGGTRGLAFSLR